MQSSRIAAVESEISALGAVLIDHDCADRVLAALPEHVFTTPNHVAIARGMRALRARGIRVDPPTIIDEVAASGLIEHGTAYALCGELLDTVPTSANVDYHVRMVREAYHVRRSEEIRAAAAEALSGGAGAAEVLERVARELEEIREFGATAAHRFLSAAEIEQLPKPEYLLDGILVRRSLAVLFGAPGSGKSFLALDWSLSIATGFRWLDRSVIQAPTLYIAAEGAAGIGVRVRAWKKKNGYAIQPAIRFLTSPIALLEVGETDRLIGDIQREFKDPPGLIVVDTLSRCMAGADENSAADMSRYVGALDRLREATGATVLIVHHTNAGGERERGSTVLRGAADTMASIRLEEGGVVVLACEKQKDSAPFSKVHLTIQPFGDSAVLGLTNGVRPKGLGITEFETELLKGLSESFMSDGATATRWLELFPKKRSSFFRAVKVLCERGFVDPGKGGRGARYTITADGQRYLVSLGIKSVPDTENVSVSHTLGGLESPQGETYGRNAGDDTDEQYEAWERERAAGGVM